MTPLTIDRFDDYFRALHSHAPYPWQQALAAQAVSGTWPSVIDLPTGSGKTACIDIAVFALACQAGRSASDWTAPRRIFFCVNRRVIVDEAHDRAARIARRISDSEERDSSAPDILRDVATALRAVAGTTPQNLSPPLDVLELRGGIYRDNRWARSLTQPTIVCTTVDQLGSRLLFRGYGVSPNAAPIQAALVAYDSLILLDEAHISRPFLQTLERVRRFLDPAKWAEQDLGIRPTTVVPMTATPPADLNEVFRMSPADRKNESLRRRLSASKPAELRQVKNVASSAVEAAGEAAADTPVTIGIIVNRITTARTIHRKLLEAQRPQGRSRPKIAPSAQIELVIGSMRPLDRDRQTERLRPLLGSARPEATAQTSIVVSTQCLEVGADYDFDVLITECASLDALRQRFGRLNRAGRGITAWALVLIDAKAVKPEDKLHDDKPLDPIYGNALVRTWNWLWENAATVDGTDERTIDFGIDTFSQLLAQAGMDGRIPLELLAPSAMLDAPVMLPAYVDLWGQTAPKPEPEPEVSLFIHGPQTAPPDMQVCWRADLVVEEGPSEPDHWCEVVALLPPTAAECMTVPLARVRNWLAGLIDSFHKQPDSSSDVLGETEHEQTTDVSRPNKAMPPAVLWRGPEHSVLLDSLQDLRPGDTLVLPTSAGGWNELGHIPAIGDEGAAGIDIAEQAFEQARNRTVLRLYATLTDRVPDTDAGRELLTRARDPDDRPTLAEWRTILRAAADFPEVDNRFRTALETLSDEHSGLLVERYPDNGGVVLTSRRRRIESGLRGLPALDDGDDCPSRTIQRSSVSLSEHTRNVLAELDNALQRLPADELRPALRLAAVLHDAGKADERFQAMLRRSDRTDAWLHTGTSTIMLAKSGGFPLGAGASAAARRRASLPNGFRHEMLSVQLAERHDLLSSDPVLRELALHVIAAHHGHARPFAPVVIDDDPPDVEVLLDRNSGGSATAADVGPLAISADDRRCRPAHRLDSGVAERFWSLTRRFGWWGLAYLEAVVRLADQQASAGEEIDPSKHQNTEALV